MVMATTKRRNQILPKHVDFLICNDRMTPLLAIELDGGSHNKPSRMGVTS